MINGYKKKKNVQIAEGQSAFFCAYFLCVREYVFSSVRIGKGEDLYVGEGRL